MIYYFNNFSELRPLCTFTENNINNSKGRERAHTPHTERDTDTDTHIIPQSSQA